MTDVTSNLSSLVIQSRHVISFSVLSVPTV